MNKFAPTAVAKSQPVQVNITHPLLTWKWAVYDGVVLGALLVGLVAGIH